MSLRRRLVMMAGVIVAITLSVGAAACYRAMSHTLNGQVDSALSFQAARVEHLQMPMRTPMWGAPEYMHKLPGPPPRSDMSAGFIQFVLPSGQVGFRSAISLPVSGAARAVAAGRQDSAETDASASGMRVRVLTEALPDGVGAVQVAYSLERVDNTLSELRLALVLLVLGGTALTVLLTGAFSRTVISPITELTDAAEHIERTGELDRRVWGTETAEVGRLARRFNAMLDRLQDSQGALRASIAAQRQLVADASHELRTPIASVRTNIEVLRENDNLPAEMRGELLDDAIEQTEELSRLVTDLIDLARGEEPDLVTEEVSVESVVDECLERASLYHQDVRFEASLEPCLITGNSARLARAVNNLLDNAAKFSPQDAGVVVELKDHELSVRDHGPGVPPAELDRLFDRFYRASNAAAYHGSGLGLAIVKQTAQSCGATVGASLPKDGGLRVWLRFPAQDR